VRGRQAVLTDETGKMVSLSEIVLANIESNGSLLDLVMLSIAFGGSRRRQEEVNFKVNNA
jgi:hypothetical protein